MIRLMVKMYRTTICVMNTTIEKIKELKVHPRQSNEDVILKLIKDKDIDSLKITEVKDNESRVQP